MSSSNPLTWQATLDLSTGMSSRYVVIGNSGSGKSTFARELAKRLDAPCIELDAHFHQAGWKESPPEIFRAAIDEKTNQEHWVIDGNYQRFLQDIVWPKAETVIWLDYPYLLVLWRVTKRTFGRLFRKEELWNGNRESWKMLFSPQSIIVWSASMHYTYRYRYNKLLRRAEQQNLEVLQFRMPREASQWLASID